MKEEMPYIELIKQIMHDYDLSQLKFASIIGVNQTTVSQWLLGRKKPTYDCIYSICVNFNVSPNLFFGFENQNSKRRMRPGIQYAYQLDM